MGGVGSLGVSFHQLGGLKARDWGGFFAIERVLGSFFFGGFVGE